MLLYDVSMWHPKMYQTCQKLKIVYICSKNSRYDFEIRTGCGYKRRVYSGRI